MKRILLVAVAVVLSTSAFAQVNGPIRVNGKCWATVDPRGFGFFDRCADRKEIAARAVREGRIGTFDAPQTTVPDNVNNSGGSGGSGGGGGGR